MYGTVARIRIKAGQEQAIVATMEEWNRERKPKVQGARDGILFRLDSDPQEMILVAMFQDKEAYVANAQDPEQDKWFQKLMQSLESEPEWSDGEIVVGG